MRIIALVMAAVALSRAPRSEPTGFLLKMIDVDSRPVKYVVYVPEAYKGEAMPLILFLHGMGEQGADGWKQVAVGIGPAIMLAADKWPFIVLFPQKPQGKGGWSEHEKLLLDLIEKTKKEYKIDDKRVYLTGLSMGGYGTWSLAASRPEIFAAIAPICGGGDPASAVKIKSIPTWVFHGDKDAVVPLAKSQQMVDALKAAGAEPKFTIYPGVGHNSWDKAYREEKLAEWFLTHEKS